jgi:hypothetical protein
MNPTVPVPAIRALTRGVRDFLVGLFKHHHREMFRRFLRRQSEIRGSIITQIHLRDFRADRDATAMTLDELDSAVRVISPTGHPTSHILSRRYRARVLPISLRVDYPDNAPTFSFL